MSGMGHNSGDHPDVLTSAAQKSLGKFLLRVEALEEDKAAISADLKEVYEEAKGQGFNVKILKRIVAERKKDRAKAAEEDALFDLYWSAIDNDL